jgi:hypothetical protein
VWSVMVAHTPRLCLLALEYRLTLTDNNRVRGELHSW